MDEVWVPTHFHAETFAAAGVPRERLFVIGEPVDTAFFRPGRLKPMRLPPLPPPPSTPPSTPTPPPPPPPPSGVSPELSPAPADPTPLLAGPTPPPPFRFLSVFKWEARKGWDALLAAYFSEFGADEPVELVVKTRPSYSSGDFETLVEDFAAERGLPPRRDRPAVRLLGTEMPLRRLPSLYAAADAFVLPSRGEGWGRPHAEAMAMGLPVIATNWSGPTAFLSGETGYPLACSLVALPPELNLPRHRWAEPDAAHLRALLREVYTDREEARRRGAAARRLMQERFSPAALAQEAVARARELLARERGAAGRRTTRTAERGARDEL
mmetsp:Transcript_36077/g.120748  ORF Transcript_36077/g.120748 Transcript_36077/m.120748 type:complete len:326 (-) Transcript_36077:47-1024(-)